MERKPVIDFSFTQAQADRVLLAHESVYIYGAGEALADTIEFLRGSHVGIYGIIDRKPELWGVQKYGVEIFPPAQLTDLNVPVIICARLRYDEIFCALKARGFTCVLPFYFYKGDEAVSPAEYRSALAARHVEIQKQIDRLTAPDPLIIESIDVVLTERCSLRCKDCANLMQFYKNPQNEDLSEQLEALDAILEAVDFVQELRVLGGEPFVSPDFPRYINHLLGYKNVGTIVVYTNGTIVPKGDTLECLKDPHVFLCISNYGRLSRHVPELKKVLSENHILYEVVSCKEWLDCSGFQDRHRSVDALKDVFEKCCAKALYTLKGGKLYGCPFIANAAALRAIPSEACKGAAICSDTGKLRTAIRQLLGLPYFEGCKYCAGRPLTTNIPAALQTAAPLAYQKLD